MSNYSIKDLEQLTGIKAHTIRIWEKRYNLVSPERTDTNIRYYTDEQLKRLLNLSLLNRNGHKISKLATMSDIDLCAEVTKLNSGLTNNALQIEHLITAMVNIDEASFSQVLNKAMVKNGFEDTLQTLIFPFLERVGVLWLTGVINPAREHFVMAILKQKIFAAYEKIIHTPEPNAPIAVLSLHEKEFHEITLLISNYIAKRLGYTTIYLGQSVPYDNVVDVLNFTKANVLITNFVTSQEDNYIESYLKRISHDFPDIAILTGGFQIINLNISLPKNVFKVINANELKEKLIYLKERKLS
jgi:DNA-binding transcriptional MerR regulator